jgi:hypothetical protein
MNGLDGLAKAASRGVPIKCDVVLSKTIGKTSID